MPYKSDAQRKAMHAAAAGHSTIGIPQEAAQRFVAHSHGESASNLPEHVAGSKKRRLKGKRKKRSK